MENTDFQFFIFQATSASTTVQDRLKQAHLDCIQENEWDANELEGLAKNEIFPENNNKFNDFVLCYWKKADLVDKNGAVNIPQLKATISHIAKERYPKISESEASQVTDQAVNKCNEKLPAIATGQSCVQLHNCFVKYIHEKED